METYSALHLVRRIIAKSSTFLSPKTAHLPIAVTHSPAKLLSYNSNALNCYYHNIIYPARLLAKSSPEILKHRLVP